MKAIIALVFLSLLCKIHSAPEGITKEYNMRIISNFEIETFDIKGAAIKETESNATQPVSLSPAPVPTLAPATTARPNLPVQANKTVPEEIEED